MKAKQSISELPLEHLCRRKLLFKAEHLKNAVPPVIIERSAVIKYFGRCQSEFHSGVVAADG